MPAPKPGSMSKKYSILLILGAGCQGRRTDLIEGSRVGGAPIIIGVLRPYEQRYGIHRLADVILTLNVKFGDRRRPA